MIETRPIIEHAERLVERIHEALEDSDGFVRSVIIAVEIDEGPRTRPFIESADDRPWVQIAFLREAADHLEAARYAGVGE